MTVYSSSDLINFVIRGKYKSSGDPEEFREEKKEFDKRFPYPFYSPAFFIRLGLFFPTVLISFLTTGLLYLSSGTPSGDAAVSVVFLVSGFLAVAGAEYFAGKRKHYQSGVDEALQFCAVLLLISGGAGLFNFQWWMMAGLATVFSALAMLRYMSVMMMVLFVISLFVFLNELLSAMFPPFIYALPLAAIAGAGSYLSGKKFFMDAPHYNRPFLFGRYMFVLLMVFFSNYFCLNSLNGTFSHTFPEMILYKFTTVVVPLSLLFYGIRRKDIVPLQVGMFMTIPTALTVYGFSGASHPFLWLTIGGAVLVLITVSLMKYLKDEHAGFVFRQVEEDERHRWLQIIAAVTAPQSTAPGEGTRFGGGDFGGGGASGSY